MRLADLPIRQKLLAMALGITAIVLLASCAILVVFDLVSLRRELTREFGTLSDVIAANSSAALAFSAEDDAVQSLKILSAERSVSLAALYDASGHLFASYSRTLPAPPELSADHPANQVFHNGQLVTYRPVTENHKLLGTLVVYTDLRWWYDRLWFYAAISLAVVGLAFLAATVCSTFLRKSITRPIDELARIAKSVSAKGDFSVRAHRLGNDELGELTDTFNHMLAQLQEREAALRESEAQRLIALEAAGLGTWIYDTAAKVSARDGSLNRLMGLPPHPTRAPLEEMIGSVIEEDRARVRTLLENSLQQRGDIDAEYRIVRPDGAVRWLRNRGRVIAGDNGAAVKMAGAVMDITERKAAEQEILRLNADLEKRVARRTSELEDSNRDLEAFAYSVSHDLRAPLRIISGYAEVLLEDRGKELPADHQMCLSRIVDGARRMNRLIDDLLQFSRLGQQPVKVQSTNLNVVIDDVLADLEREIGKRRVEWRRAPLPPISCDPALMRQVLSNILSNALKYSRPRDPTIIEIGYEQKDGMHTLFVRDNGVGFDSASSSRLFGVFQRMHGAQEFEGNGVGLAIAARVIRRHGGRIWAESQVDKGATFFFSLPV